MTECTGTGCAHPSHVDHLDYVLEQYGLNAEEARRTLEALAEHNHKAYEADRVNELLAQRAAGRRRFYDLFRDPVVKTDGRGQPVRASQTGANRAERRRLAREARRSR